MAESKAMGLHTVRVQVCCALLEQHFLRELHMHAGATIAQAIQDSKLLEQLPHIDLAQQRVGIFGKLKTMDTVVREGDRIEIYRALQADPKETRRRRAAHRKPAKN